MERPARAAAPRHELTPRAVAVAILVALLMGASFPYVVLKIGYGPNISVVSAFFGFVVLAAAGAATGRASTVYENNLVQTAGTAAGQMGFMCVVLAALDMLNARPELGFSLHLGRLQIFAWMTLAGLLGALLAVPLRRHYIDDEDLAFADGTAAGETLVVLYAGRREALARVKALAGGMGVSGLLAILRDGPWKLLPEALPLGAAGAALRLGSEVSVLSLGAGLLIGFRVTLSMAIGTLLAWVILPGPLVARGLVARAAFGDVLRWVMWPAMGLMVSGGLTALALKWRVVARSFSSLGPGAAPATGDEFPLRWVAWGSAACAIALAVVQKLSLGFPYWLTAVSLAISLPLMLVGIRTLGETNWAPISTLANLTQAAFAALAPGHMPVNMIGSGMSGTIAGQGEHLMQDYRAGKIIGSSNRHLTILQLVGVPFGALALAVVYPALRDRYGFGEGGLTSPLSVKWAGFAELLAGGLDRLPPGSLAALGVAAAAGLLLTVVDARWRFVLSPTAIGIGMVIPGYAVLPMLVGGIAQAVWARASPAGEAAYDTPLASGFIAGEALVVLGLSLLAVAGVRV